jgi:ribosomal protein S8
MTNYNFADLLVRIKVAYKAKLVSVKVLKNKLTFRFLYLLYKIGLIKAFYIASNGLEILVYLKYKKDGTPLIHTIDLVSKPGKRVY